MMITSERIRSIYNLVLSDGRHALQLTSGGDIILIDDLADEVAKLEVALDKRLKQEYDDEDHRLGGIGITFEEFRKVALEAGGDDEI